MLVTLDSFEPRSAQGFFVVEGVNGAGKSTAMAGIEKYLISKNLPVRRTYEPGDTPLGAELRKLLLNSPDIERHSTAELMLFGADRSEHVDAVIRPALANREIVLCDRYLYSSIAFQGYGRQLNLNIIDSINTLAVRDTLPDLVILLDLDAEEGLRRTRTRQSGTNAASDAFELETIEFHRRIRDGFLALSRSRAEPFLVIDATQSAEEVLALAVAAIERVLAARETR